MKYLVIDLFGIKLKAFPNKNKTRKEHPDFKITIPVWVNESKPKPKPEYKEITEEFCEL